MKIQLFHFATLVLIVGGLSLDCKVCQEGTITPEGSTESVDMSTGDYFDKACKNSDVEDKETCESEQDICVKYNLAYKASLDSVKNNIERTKYSCGKDSEDNVVGNSAFCQGEISMASFTDFTDFTCETVITKAKEETSGGEPQDEDDRCKNEMCSGDEAIQLKFILAATCVARMFA